MVTDLDGSLFHSHFFTGQNELDLADLDILYGNGAFDFEDSIGIDPMNSLALVSCMQNLFIFPMLIFFDLMY